MNKTKIQPHYFLLLILILVIVSSCKNQNLDKENEAKLYMQLIASETNKKANLPTQVDEYTIADKVVYDANKSTIIYSYRLFTTEYSANEWKEYLKEVEKEQIANAIRLHSDNKYYKILGVTIESIYRDLNDNEIYSFKIRPEQYFLN